MDQEVGTAAVKLLQACQQGDAAAASQALDQLEALCSHFPNTPTPSVSGKPSKHAPLGPQHNSKGSSAEAEDVREEQACEDVAGSSDLRCSSSVPHAEQRGAEMLSLALQLSDTAAGTAAMYAAKHGMAPLLERLLHLGADVVAGPSGQPSQVPGSALALTTVAPCCFMPSRNSPLHLAAMAGHRDVVGMLVKAYRAAGQSVDEHNVNGDTPLMFACSAGHLGVASLLLKAGADPAAHNTEGLTPLLCAASGGHALIIQLLIRHATAAYTAAATPADAADTAMGVRNSGIGSSLLEDRDRHGNSPLHFACRGGHEAATQLLLDMGADPLARNAAGRSCLQEAHLSRSPRCIAVMDRTLQALRSCADASMAELLQPADASAVACAAGSSGARAAGRAAKAGAAGKKGTAAAATARHSEAVAAEPAAPAPAAAAAPVGATAPSVTGSGSQAAAAAAAAGPGGGGGDGGGRRPAAPAASAPCGVASCSGPGAADAPAGEQQQAEQWVTVGSKRHGKASSGSSSRPAQQAPCQPAAQGSSSGHSGSRVRHASPSAAPTARPSLLPVAGAGAGPATAPMPAAAAPPPTRPVASYAAVAVAAPSSASPSAPSTSGSSLAPSAAQQAAPAPAAVDVQDHLAAAGVQARRRSSGEAGADEALTWLSEAQALLQASCPEAANLALAPQHLCGLGLSLLSMSQLEVLQTWHLRALERISEARMALLMSQERERQAEQEDIHRQVQTLAGKRA